MRSGAAEFAGEGDALERLLPTRMSPTGARRSHSRGDDEDSEYAKGTQDRATANEEDDSFTHEELLHSIGSFSAVISPVAITMLLARCVASLCFA